ncbi:shikimate dehydrogenase [Streptococcus suis]|uniref:Shikimate dehydrogenase (NADP(+)) n=1 Tax=Streptococcus suis TaxID=1307 RepID=A0A0Z8F0V9_STRSU|nr:shikimate dehydrogenase [Streptococcus suis]NQH23340.1 shikimate dehydrogenase [Streptococcus suis]NQP20839.1 shikimate dehydrogenase [Streptococcus suis]CYU71801.1 shikimate 5-dehydrogenase [Streptococcus suis]HEL1598383.1 shikimate dehydrogenase [Streptococcus suis]HEL2359922.1 shikimate dehydrogenase [Streptococcus suis]
MNIDGYTRLAAVVAKPIKHTISPFIHNLAFKETGVNGVYVALEIPEEDLAATLENIKRYDMFGINLSMPYKQAVIPYLDDLTASARLIGAVNTVIHQNGLLIGHNTDGIGFFKSLEKLRGFQVRNKRLTILGGGGASTAIIAQAALDGAKEITIFCRQQSLERTQASIALITQATGVPMRVLANDDSPLMQEEITKSDLLVNGTSVGMDGVSLPVPASLQFPEKLLVADVIYQPFETPLMKLAQSQGNPTINGLGMLLFQAAEAFQAWTGKEMPTDFIWDQLVQKYDIK